MKTFPIQIEKSSQEAWKAIDFTHLEFGRISTDHMFVADFKCGEWQDARIIPYAPMSLTPFTSALHYGQTVFEGLKAYRLSDNRISIFRPESHAARFNHSLERMCMPIVPLELFMNALDSLIRLDAHWVSDTEGTSLYIRPFMFATEDKLGVQIADHYRFMIVCSPVGKYYSKFLRVKVEQKYTRAFPGGTGFAKCGGNYGVSFYPYKEAHDEGFDQILWTDGATHQFLEESGTMNVGFIIGNKFITPRLIETILAGMTRDSLLHIAADEGLSVEERPIPFTEITAAIQSGERVEAFGIGTAATIAPIQEISVNGSLFSTYIEPDATMFRLKQRLEDIRLGKSPDRLHWNHIIEP